MTPIPGPAKHKHTLGGIELPSHVQLLAILDQAFNMEELKELFFVMGLDFESVSGDTIRGKARELILLCERKEKLLYLIDTIFVEQPQLRDDLIQAGLMPGSTAVAAKSEVSVVQPWVDGSTEKVQTETTKIEDGLNALINAMSTPEVIDAVAAFRADFAMARKLISRLRYLKRLQDLFRILEPQFKLVEAEFAHLKDHNGSWKELINQFRISDSDHDDWDVLSQHMIETITTLNTLLAVTPKATSSTNEMLWAERLAQVRDHLSQALTSSNRDLLEDSINWLEHLVAHEPDRIHDWIASAVTVLLESELIVRMTAVHQMLIKLKVAPRYVNQFGELVAALPRLRAELEQLVAGHNGWQEMDRELDRLEASEDVGLKDLAEEWSVITKTTQKLTSNSAVDLTPMLSSLDAGLQVALATKRLAEAKHMIAIYHGYVREFLNSVEEGLLAASDNLQRVGEELTRLLDTLPTPIKSAA